MPHHCNFYPSTHGDKQGFKRQAGPLSRKAGLLSRRAGPCSLTVRAVYPQCFQSVPDPHHHLSELSRPLSLLPIIFPTPTVASRVFQTCTCLQRLYLPSRAFQMDDIHLTKLPRSHLGFPDPYIYLPELSRPHLCFPELYLGTGHCFPDNKGAFQSFLDTIFSFQSLVFAS